MPTPTDIDLLGVMEADLTEALAETITTVATDAPPTPALDEMLNTLEALKPEEQKQLVMSQATFDTLLAEAGTKDPDPDRDGGVGYRGRLLGADIIVSQHVPDGQMLAIPPVGNLFAPLGTALTNAVTAMKGFGKALGTIQLPSIGPPPGAAGEVEAPPPCPDPFAAIVAIEMASGNAYDANGDLVLTLEPSGVAQFLREHPDVELR
jgi:hypothetical protein